MVKWRLVYVGKTSLSIPRANSLPGEKLCCEKTEVCVNEPNLERSRTERRKHNTVRGDEAIQIFDDKISDKKKVWFGISFICKLIFVFLVFLIKPCIITYICLQLQMLNRIATVKRDGTVAVEIPSTVDDGSLHIRTDDVCYDAVDDEPIDMADMQYIPPLQIVILIVGTRGDVQPFVAIGKRLQVVLFYVAHLTEPF